MVALTGALFEADLDGTPVAPWKSLRVKQGSTLSIKAVRHILTADIYLQWPLWLHLPALKATMCVHPQSQQKSFNRCRPR